MGAPEIIFTYRREQEHNEEYSAPGDSDTWSSPSVFNIKATGAMWVPLMAQRQYFTELYVQDVIEKPMLCFLSPPTLSPRVFLNH